MLWPECILGGRAYKTCFVLSRDPLPLQGHVAGTRPNDTDTGLIESWFMLGNARHGDFFVLDN